MFAFGHYNLGNLPMLVSPPVAATQALDKDTANVGESRRPRA